MQAVSIILPAFNPEAYITQAVESVIQQTFGGWELIIVDDGSAQPINSRVPADTRITILRQANRGLSSARNAGIQQSRGELVAFLDADDVWEPQKLSRQVNALRERPDAVLAHSQMRFIDDAGQPGGLGWGGGDAIHDDLLGGCGVCVSSVVIRREVLFRCGLFDPLLKTAQDYDLWLKATRYGPMIADPEPLVQYRIHGGNLSRDYMQSYREISFILRRHLEIAIRAGDAATADRCRRGLRRTRRNLVTQAVNHSLQAAKGGHIAVVMGSTGRGRSDVPSLDGRRLREEGLGQILRPIVFCGLGDGFNEYPGRQSLLHVVAKRTPVLFLRWRRPGEPWWRGPRLIPVKPNMYEVQNAFTLRRSRLRRFGPAGAMVDGALLSGELWRKGFGDFVYWLSTPDTTMLAGVPTHRMVYDCVDPCFLPDRQAEFDRAEAAIARKAKVVFFTAETLYRKLRPLNWECHLLPNACSSDTYAASRDGAARPPPLAGITTPIVGYMGTVDWRFDAATVEHAARALPGCTFVIVGRVNADEELRIAGLRSLGNVILTGSVSHEEGLQYTAAFDVGLIPFKPGEMNDAINPVKMYMYLVAGKPVVSTWIHECVIRPDLVMAARSADEFAWFIRAALEADDDSKRAARVAFGLANTWDVRAQAALEIMERAGLFA